MLEHSDDRAVSDWCIEHLGNPVAEHTFRVGILDERLGPVSSLIQRRWGWPFLGPLEAHRGEGVFACQARCSRNQARAAPLAWVNWLVYGPK